MDTLDLPQYPDSGTPGDAGQPVFQRIGDATYEGRPLANWGYRVGGWIVDAAGVCAVGLGMGVLLSAAGVDDDAALTVGVLGILALWLLNTTVLVGLTRGQSAGKLVAGMRIVRDDGRPARFGTGFLRDTICRLIYIVPLVFLIDSLSAVGDQRLTVRDRIVHTHVVQEPAYRRRAWILALAAVLSVAAFVGVAVASPGSWGSDSGGHYSSLDREAFVDGCSRDGKVTAARCGCIFEHFRSQVPYADYEKANATDDVDKWPADARRAMRQGIRDC